MEVFPDGNFRCAKEIQSVQRLIVYRALSYSLPTIFTIRNIYVGYPIGIPDAAFEEKSGLWTL
jgi:hypothetical protein